jgi:hypothetical protein
MADQQMKRYRALATFGVAGVLSDEGEVFYENLFTTLQIGSVSDLISARFKGAGVHELQIRMAIQLGLFQAHLALLECDGAELEPMTLEVGLDEEVVAISVGFKAAKELLSQMDELQDRISKKAPASDFEKLLCDLIGFCSDLILKVDPKTQKMEILSLLMRQEGLDLQSRTQNSVVQVVTADALQEPSQVKNYTELGDLDYSELLQRQLSNGEKNVALATLGISEGGEEDDQSDSEIAGGEDRADSETRLSGADGKAEEWNLSDSSLNRVGGEDLEKERKKSELYQQQISELNKKIKNLEEKLKKHKKAKNSSRQEKKGEQPADGEDAGVEEEQKSTFGRFKTFSKKVKGNLKKRSQQIKKLLPLDQEDEDEESSDEAVSEKPEEFKVVFLDFERKNPIEQMDFILNEFEEEVFSKKFDEFQELSEKKSGRELKKFLALFSKEIQERQKEKLEILQILSDGLKKQEAEFRHKETAVVEKVKKLERSTAFSNQKFLEISKKMVAMSSDSRKAGAGEERQMIKKIDHAQNLYRVAKEENEKLKKANAELQQRLERMKIKNVNQKDEQQIVNEAAALKRRLEVAERQADELRKKNKKLMDQMFQVQAGEALPDQLIVKERLDEATRALQVEKRRSERFKAELIALRKEKLIAEKKVEGPKKDVA